MYHCEEIHMSTANTSSIPPADAESLTTTVDHYYTKVTVRFSVDVILYSSLDAPLNTHLRREELLFFFHIA